MTEPMTDERLAELRHVFRFDPFGRDLVEEIDRLRGVNSRLEVAIKEHGEDCPIAVEYESH